MTILLRVLLIAGCLVLWFKTQAWISAKAPATRGVGDRIHDWTAPLHARLVANPRAANLILIASSAVIDLFGLYMIGASILGATLRPFIGLFTLFVLRQVCQALCTLPEPPGMIWRHPGVPALLVTYGVGNDYFFSGHTAIAVLGAIELAQTAPPWLAIVAVILALAEAITVLVLRAHYTMDVFTALCAAISCALFASWCAPWVDALVHRLL